MIARLPGLGGWGEDPLWERCYDWLVEHPRPGGLLWWLGTGSDLRRLYAATAEVTRQPAGSAVLDIPCGGGLALRGLRPGQGVRYVAADISEAMLARTRRTAAARRLGAQVETVRADVADLPYDDGEFDLVLSLTGLHCFPDPYAALRELGRVTVPGGRITGSAVLRDAGLRHRPLWLAGRAGGLMGPGCTGAELEAWLCAAGFTEVVVERSGALGYFRAVRG